MPGLAQADLVHSLEARLEAVLSEEDAAAAEAGPGEEAAGQLRRSGHDAHGRPLTLVLPRRVLLPGRLVGARAAIAAPSAACARGAAPWEVMLTGHGA